MVKWHFCSVSFALVLLLTCGVCNCHAKDLNINCISFNLRYDFKDDGLNRWENRKNIMIQFVRKEKADIICFQEVLNNQLNDLVSGLGMYTYVGVGRVDGNSKGEYAPVFYRKDKFERVDAGTFWLSENPDRVGSIGWDASLPRIATWIELREKKTGMLFFVVNTHFDHKGTIARRESAALIKKWLVNKGKQYPVILTGDLNATMQSDVYMILSSDANLLIDSYIVCKRKDGVDYTLHGFGKKPEIDRKKIDYIFVSPSFKVKKISIPREKPHHGVYLSDHNPIITWLQLPTSITN